MKYKIYAIQGVRFNELTVEADSPQKAQAQYKTLWNDESSVYSIDYDDDDVRYVVEEAEEKQIPPQKLMNELTEEVTNV